jgi:hypothetical protein
VATSPFINYFFCPKQEPRFIFETKLLSKLSNYKIIETYKEEWSTILQTYILLIFIKVFQTLLRELAEGDPYVSSSF